MKKVGLLVGLLIRLLCLPVSVDATETAMSRLYNPNSG